MDKGRKRSSRYISGIDGLRSLAVIGVILYHLIPNIMSGGYLGVPIFFVISGYLITDLLNQEWERTEKINFRQFYRRRMKRLYPALITVLVGSAFYITLFQRNLLNNLRGVVVSSLLYVNNWWQVSQGASYFSRFNNESPFTHIWSLAVEGQHYLIWPIIFYLSMRFVKNRGKIFLGVTVAALLSAIWMGILFDPSQDPTRVYYGTDTRIFSIWMGSAVAFIWPSMHLKKSIPKQAKKILNGTGIVSILVLIVSLFFLSDDQHFVYYGGMYLISLFTCFLVAVTAHPGASVNRWLTNPVFTYIGQRSYGIYLYQFPVMIFYEAKIKNLADHVLLHTVIELALIMALSEISYRFIEDPLRKFDYSNTWETIKGWFTRPFISKQKPWQAPIMLIVIIALFGIFTAPKNKIDADQKDFESEIVENQKIAENTKKNTPKKSDKTDTSAAQNEQAENNTAEEGSPETNEQAESFSKDGKEIAKKYDLSTSIVKKAHEKELTLIGDSVALGTAQNINELFPKAVVDAIVSRQFYDSIPVIQSLKDQGLLKKTVVIALGTNGSFSGAQFDEMMKALSDREVYFINVRVPTRRWQNEVNTALEKNAKSYSNAHIVDWYDTSKDHDEWFRPDRIHPEVKGRVAYTKLLAKTILDKK